MTFSSGQSITRFFQMNLSSCVLGIQLSGMVIFFGARRATTCRSILSLSRSSFINNVWYLTFLIPSTWPAIQGETSQVYSGGIETVDRHKAIHNRLLYYTPGFSRNFTGNTKVRKIGTYGVHNNERKSLTGGENAHGLVLVDPRSFNYGGLREWFFGTFAIISLITPFHQF